MAINLSGMASGLDTESIIQQLMSIEQNKVTAVKMRQVSVTQHKTDLSNIKTKLDTLSSAAAALASPSLYKATQTTASSDPTKLDVQVLGGAGIGGHSIQINRLASSAQHGFDYTPDAANAGKLTFYYGADPNAADISKVTIDVPANATATDIATAVNANEAAPVYAAVVKDGTTEKLVFSSRKTGDKADFTVDTSAMAAGSSLSTDPAYERTTNLNAEIYVDGSATALHPESNIVDTIIPGVRVTLKGITTSPATVATTQPAVDPKAIADKVTALVNAYNDVVTATRAQLTERRDPKATTTFGLQAGALFGDTQLNAMLTTLKTQMRQSLGGLGLSGLADLGVDVPKASSTVTQEAKDGKLVIDTTKLTDAINADYTKVRDLFAGKSGVKGLSGLLSDYVTSQTGSDGTLTGRMKSDDTTLKGFDDQITRLNDRMKAEQDRLKKQFAAMESALANSQTQQAWLTSQIKSLGNAG